MEESLGSFTGEDETDSNLLIKSKKRSKMMKVLRSRVFSQKQRLTQSQSMRIWLD